MNPNTKKFYDTTLKKLEDRIKKLEGYAYIVETIENENGKAVKFSDGTMIYYHSKFVDVNFSSIYDGSLYGCMLENPFTFPIAFTNYPTVNIMNRSNIQEDLYSFIGKCEPTFSNIKNLVLLRSTKGTGKSILSCIAIGKWK